jgi:hypothetical protein
MISIRIALIKRRHDTSFGKMRTTRVRRPGQDLRLDLLAEPLQVISGSQSMPVLLGKIENRQTLREVLLHPGGEPGSLIGILCNGSHKIGFQRLPIRRIVEDPDQGR